MIKLKECVACKLPKTVDLFFTQENTKDGYRGSCKVCVSIRNKKYHDKNKVTINTKRRKNKEIAKAVKATPQVKKVRSVIDLAETARIKAIMAVPVNVEKTQAHWMSKKAKQAQKEIRIR